MNADVKDGAAAGNSGIGEPAGGGASSAEIRGLGIVDVAQLPVVQHFPCKGVGRIEAAGDAQKEGDTGLFDGFFGFPSVL